jgi:hypothetical protein
MDKVAVGSKIESQRQPYSVEQVTMILNRAQHESDDIFLPPVEPNCDVLRREVAHSAVRNCRNPAHRPRHPAGQRRWPSRVPVSCNAAEPYRLALARPVASP